MLRAIVLGALLAIAGVACRHANEPEEEARKPRKSVAKDDPPLVEERAEGSAEWVVQSDGTVRVRVKTPTGFVVSPPDVKGQITVAGATKGLEAWGDWLRTKITLSGDLTAIDYSLDVNGAAWTGTLHVPPGGTSELVKPPAVTVANEAVGPHGGIVDVVGDQRFELLVDEESGEVRAYLLDEALQPVPAAKTEMTVGFVEGP